MRVLRFVLPFLFVRNWYDGSWEFSRARCILFCLSLALIALGVAIAHVLQSPVVHPRPV